MKPKKNKTPRELHVIIDTREQDPVLSDKEGDPSFPGLKVSWSGLKTGDYSLVGMDSPDCAHSVTIERKSLPDLFGSTGRGRVRLEREFIRMSYFDYAEFVVEADLKTVLEKPPELSSMLPKSVYRTVLAFSQRYSVGCWFCPSKDFAEKHIYLSLRRFRDDRLPGGKMFFSKI